MENKISHANFYRLLRMMHGVDKEELVWESSKMLTTSLTEFYEKRPDLYKAMIKNMERSTKVNSDDAIRQSRSAILFRLQKHGIDTTNWKEVNAFLSQPRICGKMLWEMTTEELKALIPKLESILAKDLKMKTEIERLKQLN